MKKNYCDCSSSCNNALFCSCKKTNSFTFGAQGFFGERLGKVMGKGLQQDAFDMMKQAGPQSIRSFRP